MATLVFCIFNFQGELNGSLNLAKKLKALGHQVYYLGLADSRENVQFHGFEFLTILENWFPINFFKRLDFNQNTNKLHLILERISCVKNLKHFIHSLTQENNQEIHLIIKKTNPDLLILSTTEGSYATFLGLIAYECQIPSIYLTDMFPSLPPCKNTQSIYTADNKFKTFSFLQIIDLLNTHISQRLIKIFSLILNIDIDYKDAIFKYAAKAKIPLKELDLSRNSPLIIPHLFLCPKEFELPNVVRESCCYAEPSIDLFREQNFNFCWNKLDDNKKIVYCSFGTTSGTFETLGMNKIKKFFQAVIDSISLSFRDEYQLIVATGNYIHSKMFKSLPDNVLVLNQLPQLALLEKSSLAIIAGGIHTVKECIFFGVPMIIFPVWADQPDNAERVKHHGLGLIGNIENISTEYVTSLIKKIQDDISFQQNPKLWKQRFREIETSNKATQFILKTLSSNKT